MTKTEAFKKELSCYKYYLAKLKELDNEIDANFYKETGVSAISYDKVPTHSSEEAKAQFRLSLIEKGDELAIERDRVAKQIKHIESIVDALPKVLRKAIIQIYVNGMTYLQFVNSGDVYWTDAGLYKAIERELNKLL